MLLRVRMLATEFVGSSVLTSIYVRCRSYASYELSSKEMLAMAYESLTQRAGWYIATPGTFSGVQDGIPYYKKAGALGEFMDIVWMHDCRVSDYQPVLDRKGIVIEPDIAALSVIDVTVLDGETILAILSKCCSYARYGYQLLYDAAASALLDRCLYRLRDIDRMSAPPMEWYEDQRRKSHAIYSTVGSWMDYDSDHLPGWIWCLVGNVIDEHAFGPDHQTVHGTRHFSPGTKVYCFPWQWGDGYEKIPVLGRHKGRRGLIKLVMRRDLIENFRCQKVHSPYVIRRMYERDGHSFIPWGNSEQDHQDVMSLVKWLSEPKEEAERRRLMGTPSGFVLSTHVEGFSEGDVTIRAERHDRSDGCIGSAWFGFSRIGSGRENPLGIIDTYGYWPEGVPYDEVKANYKQTHDLAMGFIEAGVHLWDDFYMGEVGPTRHSFTWRVELVGEALTVTSGGLNEYPENLPPLLRVLEAWGFPKIWDSGEKAPVAQLLL